MRGEQGDTIPRALNDCGSPKSPNNVATIFFRTNICFQKISSTIVEGRQTCFLPRRHLTPLRFCQYTRFCSASILTSKVTSWPQKKKVNDPLWPRSPASNACMFSTAWNQGVWNENYAKKKQLLCLSRNPSQCALQVNWIHYAASGQSEVSWSGIYEWGKKKQGLWYMGWWSIRSTAGCLSLCGDKTGAFKHRKANTF